ncbi:MAG: ribosome maturation factor RimP [Thermaceae bacterium]
MELEALIQKAVRPLGLVVLEVSLRPQELLVRLEREDETPITLKDLEAASRAIEQVLDEKDPIPGSYRLLVESPGPQRPLLTKRHFERFQGLKAKVVGTERFTGRILRVEENHVVFLVNGEEKRLELGTFKANLAEWPETPR